MDQQKHIYLLPSSIEPRYPGLYYFKEILIIIIIFIHHQKQTIMQNVKTKNQLHRASAKGKTVTIRPWIVLNLALSSLPRP